MTSFNIVHANKDRPVSSHSVQLSFGLSPTGTVPTVPTKELSTCRTRVCDGPAGSRNYGSITFLWRSGFEIEFA